MLKASYRAYTDINYMVIELIRQFYNVQREFRITGDNGQPDYVTYSNQGIAPQVIPPAVPGGQEGYRKPVFDIIIKPEKSNPFSRMANNEMIKELFGMGFFNPELADQALAALSQMDFEGKDALIEKLDKNRTLLAMCQQLSQQLMAANQMLYMVTGGRMGSLPTQEQQMAAQAAGQPRSAPAGGAGYTVDPTAGMSGAAKNATTSYGQRLAERARADVHDGGNL